MDITLTVDEPMSRTLNVLAKQRGVSVEQMTYQILAAGLKTLQPVSDSVEGVGAAKRQEHLNRIQADFAPEIESPRSLHESTTGDHVILPGSLHTYHPPEGHILQMPSPLISLVPVLPRVLEPVATEEQDIAY